ncbi:MAG TPA: hypothetical protein VFZ69_06160 [Longimicrobiales bacterium]
MRATDDRESRLASAVAGVYGGPLEEFVRRRDTLAKELRSAGERESATTVKGLRKPSRTAWALNMGTLNSGNAIDALVEAVAGTLEAQGAGGDVRGAISRLRAAVREFASQAAAASEEAGYRVDPSVLANAVLAVIGKPESFTRLRGGCLADIPEAGGLDFLAGLPSPPVAVRESEKPLVRAAPSSSSQDTDVAAARAAMRQAADVLADARRRSLVAQQALRTAESKLEAAEERVRHAEAEARSARSEIDHARRDAEAATARLADAENAAAEAERRLDGHSLH